MSPQPDDNGPSREQLLHERQRAEQATRDTAAQLQAVINTAVDGIIAINERGIIEWLNPAAMRIFGYSAEEVIGRNVSMLMPEPYHSEHDQYLRNYVHTGHAKIIGIGREVQGKRKDGSVFPLDLAVSEARLGERRMFTGMVRDITQRKEEERALKQAKDAAEAASKVKDHFLALVSHELRTPLNPILAAVSLLESRPDLSDEVREDISAIRRNVEREARLVDDLLSLSRLVRGTMALHQEVVDAHSLLREVIGQVESEVNEKDLNLTTALRAREHHIWADPIRMQQVLSNLLKNAAKFTPQGGQIDVRTLNSGHDRLRVEVIDTGIGIEPETLARLFTPFEQGDQSAGSTHGGLGVGLAISKAIVDLHGGKLEASSAGRGRGTSFAIELTAVPKAVEVARPGSPQRQTGVSLHVLLVEDHKDTLRIMTKLLTALGYKVTAATSVREALKLADEQPFDVLVSDIGLPDGTGLEIMRQIRAKRAVKGIAVSGFGQPEDLTRSREAGFTDHLVKPINVHRLQTALEQLIA